MTDKKTKELCPACGQPMDFVKSEKKPINQSKSIDSTESKDEDDSGYSIYEIWNCLNCSTTWEKDIMNNISRKIPFVKE
ncbi:hypothetical protein AYK24_07060 [Thermoplasmatales archaeon SG8-52-4]|nr:MAG: hypothetical protein AYK24_07060 [Thermoplasmatales archaeon SG8-52-4]